MNNFFEYALKSGLALSVFYLFYWFILQKDTNFRLNRFVLMFSLIISMLLPAIADLIKVRGIESMSLAIDFSTAKVPAVVSSGFTTEKTSYFSSWTLWKILGAIYMSGAILVLARLAYQAVYLHAVSRLSKTINYDRFKLVSLDTDMVPFSYFNKIFIPEGRIEKDAIDSVIEHEKSHLSQGHYIDLFIVQIVSVLQWFNPFIWLFEKSLKETHEYLADEAVLETGKNIGKYQAILVNQALGGPVFLLTNQFNQSLIKKRIIMMKNIRSSRSAGLKALLLMPLIAVMLLAFANPDVISQSASKIVVKGNVSESSTGKPLPGSVVIIKGTTIGTITDAEGNYLINVNGTGDKLVVSQMGHHTEEALVGSNTEINFQLEADVLAVDFSKGNQLLGEEKPARQYVSKEEKNVYAVVEELPSYPGGTDALQKFLMSNLLYPEVSKNKGIQGTVQVTFIIDETGSVAKAKVLRGVAKDIDLEALRLTNSMKGWKPASQNGHAVSTVVTMPIEFKLN